jgi:hypothetical protein
MSIKRAKRHNDLEVGDEYKEIYNIKKLVYVIENYGKLGLTPIKHGDSKSIENSVKQLKMLLERLVITKKSFPYGHCGVRYYRSAKMPMGRIYPQTLSYCSMSKILRHTFSDNLYYDVDIVNCHPTILLYLAEKLNAVPSSYAFLKQYVENRSDVINEVIALNHRYKVTSDEVKVWFLKLFNGGDGTEHMLDNTVFMEEVILNFPALRQFIIGALMEDSLFAPIKENTDNKISFLSHVLFYYENLIRETMEKWCKEQQFEWSVNCFDGGMIKKTIDFTEEKLNELETYIFAATQMKIHLKLKDMTQYSLQNVDDEFITFDYVIGKTGYDSQKYDTKKLWFEQNNFFCSDIVKYYTQSPSGFVSYSKTDFVNKFEHLHVSEENSKGESISTSFMSKWVKDETKRSFSKVGLYPPGYPLPKNPIDLSDTQFCYSLWNGFLIEKIPRMLVDYNLQVQILRSLTSYLWNNDVDCVAYVEKYLKRMLVYPGIKSQVCIVLKAIRGGEGKNTWFDIQSKMFGADFCQTIQNHERDWFGSFNEVIKEKIWIHCEEMSKDLMKKNIKQFLSYITSNVDLINAKGGAKGSYPSYSNYFITFNTAGVEPAPGVQRRMFASEVNRSQPHHTMEYLTQLYSNMNNQQIMRQYYDYIMSIDISQFNVTQFPSTPYQTKLFGLPDDECKNLSRTEQFIMEKIISFFNENFNNNLKIANKVLFEELKLQCPSNFLPRIQTFTTELSLFEGFTKVMNHGSVFWNIDIDRCVKTLEEKNWRKRIDFGYTEELSDGVIYQVKVPCWKSCEFKSPGSIGSKWVNSLGAMHMWKTFKRTSTGNELPYICQCGGSYLIYKQQ